MRYGESSRQSHLFSEIDMHGLLEAQKKALYNEVSILESNRLLNTSVDDLCDYLVEKYRLDPPVLLKDQAVADQKEAQIDVSGDSYRDIRDRSVPVHVPGTRVTLEVPFEGEADFFRVRPATFTSAPPLADVRGNTLVLSVAGTDLKPEGIKSKFDRTLNEIRQYLGWITGDAQQLNDQLPALARQAVESRREKLLRDQSLVASIGFPLKQRANAPTTYSAPEVRRKAVPELPKAGTAPFEPELTLDIENYEHILKVVSNMVQVMERSPSAFRQMNEEALRDHFLVQLNGQYEGNATGETFNLSGKTDILIRVKDRNIFIAECKFWHGPKSLLEAIDQLLGYTNWRDTKTAILLFNRNKNFSRVVETIPDTVADHPNVKRQMEYTSESGFRFMVGHRDDMNRELLLTVLAFDVPT